MKEKYALWSVRYDVAPEAACDCFNNGVLYVVARNKYEAIGKALTVPGMESTVPDLASLEAKLVILLHPADKDWVIKVLDLSDLMKD